MPKTNQRTARMIKRIVELTSEGSDLTVGRSDERRVARQSIDGRWRRKSRKHIDIRRGGRPFPSASLDHICRAHIGPHGCCRFRGHLVSAIGLNRKFRKCGSAERNLSPREKHASARVDFQRFAFLDVLGNLDHDSRLESCRLRPRSCGVSFYTRITLGDL